MIVHLFKLLLIVVISNNVLFIIPGKLICIHFAIYFKQGTDNVQKIQNCINSEITILFKP